MVSKKFQLPLIPSEVGTLISSVAHLAPALVDVILVFLAEGVILVLALASKLCL